ncbi:HNH endonuclease [Candidatus Eisenbacteria bacterium]|uniref:HNH endonuclease n=1 Tax=Eiseniibacteriota bacterium TaxID=2212470 RepID=A0ABV6YLT8_UNCEI
MIYECSACQAAIAKTDHGLKRIGASEIEAIRCDATIEESGRRTRSTIPPSVRSRVLARDRHRCQAPGCARTRFLEVHHVRPVARGGSNRLENLTTLCSGCHRLQHSHSRSQSHFHSHSLGRSPARCGSESGRRTASSLAGRGLVEVESQSM